MTFIIGMILISSLWLGVYSGDFFKSRNKCDHEYEEIDTITKPYIDEVGKVRLYKSLILYCPKCNKEKKVNKDDYYRKLKKEKLRENYKRRNSGLNEKS